MGGIYFPAHLPSFPESLLIPIGAFTQKSVLRLNIFRSEVDIMTQSGFESGVSVPKLNIRHKVPDRVLLKLVFA